MSERPLPKPTLHSQPYWDGARQGRLTLQFCPRSGRFQHYPRPVDLATLAPDVEWRVVGGRGRIYSYTINYRSAGPPMAKRVPYCIALIELDDAPGVRLLANIVDCDFQAVAVGKVVEAVFERLTEQLWVPQFRLTE